MVYAIPQTVDKGKGFLGQEHGGILLLSKRRIASGVTEPVLRAPGRLPPHVP
jgi:hypothetical protein